MQDSKAVMEQHGACRADNEATKSLFASHGAGKSLQANVNRLMRSFPVSSPPGAYELTPGIQYEIVKWTMDYFYGNEEFPYPYVPNIARPLERTVEEKITNEVYDDKLVERIQSSGRYVDIQRPKRDCNGKDVNWSVFPRFNVVPLGYPINTVEERFAKLVGWQLACFQQRTTTLNTFYINRLNAVSGDWLLPEHINVDLSSWEDRSFYMNNCYLAIQQAEHRCESIIEDYVIRFVREANVFVDNVQRNVNGSENLFEDYKNMQLDNVVCSAYGFMRKLSGKFGDDFQHLKSGMLLAGNTASANLLQATLENRKRCASIDWANALSWFGIVLSKSLSMFMGCDKTKEHKIKRAANDPGGTGSPPPFNHVFFGKHKVFHFLPDD